MNRALLVTSLVVLTTATLLWVLPAAAQRPKRAAIQEIPIGQVPNEFGECISLTGTPNNWALLFRDDKGELRLVEFRGNKLSTKAYLIRRRYQ